MEPQNSSRQERDLLEALQRELGEVRQSLLALATDPGHGRQLQALEAERATLTAACEGLRGAIAGADLAIADVISRAAHLGRELEGPPKAQLANAQAALFTPSGIGVRASPGWFGRPGVLRELGLVIERLLARLRR